MSINYEDPDTTHPPHGAMQQGPIRFHALEACNSVTGICKIPLCTQSPLNVIKYEKERSMIEY